MQRSLSHQNSLTTLAYVVGFVVYSALSGIYLFLPPLFAVLFVLFSRALKREDSLAIVLVSFCLIVFESENGYILFSSIIFFLLIYKYIMPKIAKNFSCNSCVKLSSVLVVYLGFYMFNLLLTNIFLLPTPSIDYYVIYYILLEFFLVSIL